MQETLLKVKLKNLGKSARLQQLILTYSVQVKAKKAVEVVKSYTKEFKPLFI